MTRTRSGAARAPGTRSRFLTQPLPPERPVTGALPFHVRRTADNVEDAFHSARNDAIVDHGGAGYSGSIADKSGFSGVMLPPTVTFVHLARAVGDRNDDVEHSDSIDLVVAALGRPAFERAVAIFNDKHGPALAIQTAENTWDLLGLAPWCSTRRANPHESDPTDSVDPS